jgi:hypothetical protein
MMLLDHWFRRLYADWISGASPAAQAYVGLRLFVYVYMTIDQ